MLQLIDCLESPSSEPHKCNEHRERKCSRSASASTHGNYYNNILRYSELDDTCYSVSMDMCDFHEDCIDGEDERFEKNPDCGELFLINLHIINYWTAYLNTSC